MIRLSVTTRTFNKETLMPYTLGSRRIQTGLSFLRAAPSSTITKLKKIGATDGLEEGGGSVTGEVRE
jgi:hypothetical protein